MHTILAYLKRLPHFYTRQVDIGMMDCECRYHEYIITWHTPHGRPENYA